MKEKNKKRRKIVWAKPELVKRGLDETRAGTLPFTSEVHTGITNTWKSAS